MLIPLCSPNNLTTSYNNIDKPDHEGKAMSITRGKDNVFEDLGFDAEEAANLKIRADLMLDIRQYIQDQGWTQAAAAAFFGRRSPVSAI